MSRYQGGNADPCPQEPTHGRMWMIEATKRQYCPHVAHKGESVYEYDGKTPITRKGADLLARDLR